MLALRVTYVGELGWETARPGRIRGIPSTRPSSRPARAARLRGCRLPAIESLRLEKGYRAWGADIGPDHSPLAGGPGLGGEAEEADTPFQGREALEAAAPRSPCRACSLASPPLLRWCCSAARRSIATACASAGSAAPAYGYTVGKSIGYGYVRDPAGVDREHILTGGYELEVAGERVAAEVFLGPLYDPGAERVRA